MGHYSDTLGHVEALYLATLTLDPASGVTPDESRKYAVHLWSLWRRRLGRIERADGSSGPVPYVATVEHQSGTGLAHIHAIISLPGISADAAAAAWTAIGGGIVCDVQPISAARSHGSDDDGPRGSAARSIGYVLKYALKEATEHPQARRRYVLASEGTGYHSAPAVERRRVFVENRDGVSIPRDGSPRAVAGTRYVEVLTPAAAVVGRTSPDAVTPADRLRFAALRAANRRTSYRYLDKRTGRWYRISQDGEQRTRVRIDAPDRWRHRDSVPPPAPR